MNPIVLLIGAIAEGIGKAIQAPAEQRAKIIADTIAAHTEALDALRTFQGDSLKLLSDARDEIERLKTQHARELAALKGP